ncbi:nitrous oxide reductase family maturation protein NosD [bacterium]|nr:nitrous oxide reductase family maturation protein NosD [bacterium]
MTPACFCRWTRLRGTAAGRSGRSLLGLLAALALLSAACARPSPPGARRWTAPGLAAGIGRAPARPAQGHEIAPGSDLQAAVDAAPAGATLCLAPGEYAGPLRISRPLTLWGPRAAVLRTAGQGHTIDVEATDVHLLGFSIRGSGMRFEQTDAALRLHGEDLSAEGLFIAEALFGISVERSRSVRIAGNEIQGTPAAERGLRGDAIRFWEVKDSLIEDNLVTGSRDIVIWYSPGNAMLGNRVEDGRYGTHFMYSHGNAVRGNVYLGNTVGIFLMYSNDVAVTGNLIAAADRAGGMGIGLKEVGNAAVEGNRLVRNPTGIFIDTSPIQRDHHNRFRGNALEFCDVGIAFHSSEARSCFTDNNLRGCAIAVLVDGGGNALQVNWAGNYFDEYSGYDLDGNGAGDVPHEPRRLSQQLTSSHEQLHFFRGTPAVGLLDVVSRVFPVLAPKALLRDDNPRMRALPAPEVSRAH